jgi:uncharacterized protein YukE
VAGMEMNVDAVRALAASARARLGELPALAGMENDVKQGAAVLRHERATSNSATAAERLQELISELILLTGDVVSAMEKAATTMEHTDMGNAGQFEGAR